MSKLYHSDTGYILSTLGEELTTCRRARKVLDLPGTAEPATLYVLARPYPGSGLPLRVAVNGTEIEPIQPLGFTAYLWHSASLPPGLLRAGANTLEFWNDASAMNAWALGLEGGHRDPASYVSDDGGQHWRNERMAYLNILAGEYVVRVRLAEGEDGAPPPIAWEDPRSPRLAHLRQVLPPEAVLPGPALPRVRALSTWLSTRWHHTDSGKAQQYAPWDAETLLAWGRVRTGHDGRLPITMCVHYGAAFVTCAQAAGIPARAVVTTDTVNSYNGHFVAEAWIDELGKWALVDPNLDALFFEAGVPLSAREVQAVGGAIERTIEWGPGADFQRRHPHIETFVRDNYLRGVWIRSYSIWARADFLARPELTPPGHGMTAYAETPLVWQAGLRERGFGMFPYFADEAYFAAPPAEAN
jgi:hypothetical protein